jgi:eukaryotic-like serine/threonine-protein kinase
MSTVYRAFDVVLERPVAVKLMHREIAADSDQLERFRREARSVAQLSHPHVVTVIDAGEEHAAPDAGEGSDNGAVGTPYIVFEYVQGETLKDVIRREGPLEITQALAYAIEIARAGRGARAPDRPPRRQASQHPDRRGRRRQDHRLRDRPLPERGGADDGRAGAGHDRLRLARAGSRPSGDGPVRPLLARGGPV